MIKSLLCAVMLSPALVFSLSGQKSSTPSISFLPETFFSAEMLDYFLQKNSTFENRYFLGLNLGINLSLFSIKDRYYQKLIYRQKSGFGKQGGAILLDPRDASFHADFYGEYRLNVFKIQAGLEHPCFHEIDRLENPTLYWNKLFLGLESNNYVNHFKTTPSEYVDRFNWRVTWGYFLRKFGNIDESALFPANLPYIHELNMDCTYDAYTWRNLVVSLQSATMLGRMENGMYWSQSFGGSVELRNRIASGALYFVYTLDDVYWPLSKDKLLEIGVRVQK